MSLQQVAGSALGNASSIIANISVLAIFGSIVAAGVMKGLKEYRDFVKPASTAATPAVDARVAAATILENVTLSEWTASNKEVVVALHHVCDKLDRVREELMEHRMALKEDRLRR